MWDYDKLFADGNIVGIKNEITKEFGVYQITRNKELPRDAQYFQYGRYWDDFANTLLARSDIFIQYIIRLDEHGNVVEKLFDREKDMKPKPEPMPELKDGMFIRVAFKNNYLDQDLGFINLSRGQIIYQEGGYDWADNIKTWKKTKIIEIYDPRTLSFHSCRYTTPIWRSPEYQAYLDSKYN